MSFEQTTRIEHDLHPHLPSLREFHSTRSLEESKLYQELKPKILKVLNDYIIESLAPTVPAEPYYRVVAWNIERGICFDEIIYFLKNHPILSKADILLMTETDLGMARSGNRNVAREIASRLEMNYFFAPSYLNLAKGSGIENEFEGENELGIHGNAILSRYPILKPRIVSLPNAHDKMKGREKRIGHQRALIATIDLGGEPVRVGCAHLDVRSTQKDRKNQMATILKALSDEVAEKGPRCEAAPSERPERTAVVREDRERGTTKQMGLYQPPILIGGDWNTSTYDSHSALSAIIGFWVRVVMGTGNMICNHYPHPDRLFEKKLFKRLEESGFDYKGCNELGIGTAHYNIEDIKQYKNLREWIPDWCFQFIEWSLKDHGGRCSFKLDWFAQKKLKVLTAGEGLSDRKGPSLPPRVIGNLIHNGKPASDHDAIVVDFLPY